MIDNEQRDRNAALLQGPHRVERFVAGRSPRHTVRAAMALAQVALDEIQNLRFG